VQFTDFFCGHVGSHVLYALGELRIVNKWLGALLGEFEVAELVSCNVVGRLPKVFLPHVNYVIMHK